jgi:serine protease Do
MVVEEEGKTIETEPEIQPTMPWLMVKRLMIITLVVALVGGFTGAYIYNQFILPSTTAGTTASRQLIVQENSAVISVAKKVSPSVVAITAQTTIQGFFGPQESTSSGTGIIVSSDGLIMTNRHVVSDTAATYTVKTSGGKELKNARVVARDTFNDIAFMRVDDKGLPAATVGDSASIQVGQKVVAIGNALGQLQNTVTEGIVSGIGRPVTAGSASDGSSEQLTNMLQTDAAINPGNSGGPLVNLDGQVIGMNTAVAGDGAQGIGFAIPANDVTALIASVEKSGKIVRPYMGVRYVPVTKDIASDNNLKTTQGAWLKGSSGQPSIISGGPAEKAGLQDGDVIIKVNGDDVTATTSIQSLIGKYQPGQKVDLLVERGGKDKTISLVLGEAPATQ